MSHKFSLVPIGIILLVGAVWAGTSMFPDRPADGFPAQPVGAGTIGGVLTSYFGADGTANNTLGLGGVTATEYLKGGNCTGLDVWKGVDASGNIICAPKTRVLAQVGRITAVAGTTTVVTEEGATARPAVVGDILKEGSTIQTAGGGSATITFTDDLSLLRLDQNTMVEIKLPESTSPTSSSIASVIVNNGIIWGRVLTTDGVEFGGGGVIAGVRGTSISMKNASGPVYTLTIPHSQQGARAALLSSRVYIDGVQPGTASNSEYNIMEMGTMNQVTYYSGSTHTSLPTGTSTIPSLTQLYNTDPWVRSNTLLDIAYMKALSPTSAITAELIATIPAANAKIERQQLCADNNGIWYNQENGCVFAYADNTTGNNMWTNSIDRTIRRATQVRMNIPAQIGTTNDATSTRFYDNGQLRTRASEGTWNGYQYWSLNNLLSGLPNTISGCQSSAYNDNGREFCIVLNQWRSGGWTHLLIRNPSSGTRSGSKGGMWSWNMDNWYHYNYESVLVGIMNPATTQVFNTTTTIPTNATYNSIATRVNTTLPGYTITNKYEHIEVTGFSSSQLAGKTITIELGGTTTSNGVLVDFGTTNYRIQRFGTGYTCYWPGAPTPCATTNGNTVTFRAPTSGITAFIIGNNSLQIGSTSPFTRPIGAAINKVIISN